eukprot:TRINITY_DN31931_c0_g1_i2.p1 TRINITY_DN31931_c0_g1~~TRINITY_DN31931_c0_g1_i2.p1  ORF type:complete len:339 (-),score=54.50 TRINITY_DN31931_c0_g1_i2:67-1083(-)
MDAPGLHLSPAERMMRETMDWVLQLPEEERALMEVAKNYPFTTKNPAPRFVSAGSRHSGKPLLTTLNDGSMEAVELLHRLGLRPAVLNFAHGHNCGGGFEHAGGSQEEDIFRKSSAFLSLWPRRRTDDGPGVLARGMWIGEYDDLLSRKDAFYPHTECGGIYSPHVRLVRRVGEAGVPIAPAEDIAKLPCFSLLTAAAQDLNRESPFQPKLLREKLRTVLHMAAVNEHDALVVGAFGCGFFRNPPEVVAQTYQDLLRGEFAGVFRTCIFAVPDRHGPNLDAFAARFALTGHEEVKVLVGKGAGLDGVQPPGAATATEGQPADSRPFRCCLRRRSAEAL